MMRKRISGLAALAVAGVMVSGVANAADASVRTSEPAKNESEMHGSGVILAVLAVAAIIAAIVIAAGGSNDNSVSP
jgi:hypothetical protein